MMTKLKIGKVYWIFTGMMEPIQAILTELVNDGRTALFENIARKKTSVYISKKEALEIYKY